VYCLSSPANGQTHNGWRQSARFSRTSLTHLQTMIACGVQAAARQLQTVKISGGDARNCTTACTFPPRIELAAWLDVRSMFWRQLRAGYHQQAEIHSSQRSWLDTRRRSSSRMDAWHATHSALGTGQANLRGRNSWAAIPHRSPYSACQRCCDQGSYCVNIVTASGNREGCAGTSYVGLDSQTVQVPLTVKTQDEREDTQLPRRM